MKAMFWASIMMGMILATWGIVFVDVIHPLQMEIVDTGNYDDCERCAVAYSTVFQCMLTFFQQIVAGDSWGLYTLTMIDRHPWTLVLYLPAYFMIGMGLVNLTLAAIVDRAADARKANEADRLKLKLKVVKCLFSEMDADGSGSVGIGEFLEGLSNSPTFEEALSVLGIRVDDVKAIFQMMDLDNTGSVSYDEFVINLAKMKNEESFMVLLFVKHFMNTLESNLEGSVTKIIQEMRKACEGLQPGAATTGVPFDVQVDATEECGKSKWCQEKSTDTEPLLREELLRKELDSLRAQVNEDVMLHVTDMTQRLGCRLANHQEQLHQLAADTAWACRISLAQQRAAGSEHLARSLPVSDCTARPATVVSVPITTGQAGRSQFHRPPPPSPSEAGLWEPMHVGVSRLPMDPYPVVKSQLQPQYQELAPV